MDNLEKIKILIYLDKVSKLGINSRQSVINCKNLLELEWGLYLNTNCTTPQKLFGKKYSELSKSEVNQYSQIKRLIRRYTNG